MIEAGERMHQSRSQAGDVMSGMGERGAACGEQIDCDQKFCGWVAHDISLMCVSKTISSFRRKPKSNVGRASPDMAGRARPTTLTTMIM